MYVLCLAFVSFSRRSMNIISTALHFFENPSLEIGY